MRKLSETNFYSLKDSEEIFLINKENKYNISYKNFIIDIAKCLEYISKLEKDTITIFIDNAYYFIVVLSSALLLKKKVNALNNNSPKYVESIINDSMIYISDDEKSNISLKDIFEKDAIIMQNIQSNKIYLKEKDKEEPILEFDFTGFPYLAIWSKKGAPFVCIEPWYNTADYKESTGIFEEKQKIIGLNPKEKFKCKYKIKFF